jgi:polyhydroxyalkanoate synthesis regulator protein
MSNTVQRIVKYGNRKLYAPSEASYVSMLQLSDLVAKGQSVEVVLDETGEDITLETLTRALYERVKCRDRAMSKLTSEQVASLFGLVISTDSARSLS